MEEKIGARSTREYYNSSRVAAGYVVTNVLNVLVNCFGRETCQSTAISTVVHAVCNPKSSRESMEDEISFVNETPS